MVTASRYLCIITLYIYLLVKKEHLEKEETNENWYLRVKQWVCFEYIVQRKLSRTQLSLEIWMTGKSATWSKKKKDSCHASVANQTFK